MLIILKAQEEISALQEEIPVGRIGLGEDIAKAALYLDEATYVSKTSPLSATLTK